MTDALMLAAVYLPIWTLPAAGWLCLALGLLVSDYRERGRRRRARAPNRRRR